MAGFMKHKFGERGHRVWRIILEHKYLQVRGALQYLGRTWVCMHGCADLDFKLRAQVAGILKLSCCDCGGLPSDGLYAVTSGCCMFLFPSWRSVALMHATP